MSAPIAAAGAVRELAEHAIRHRTYVVEMLLDNGPAAASVNSIMDSIVGDLKALAVVGADAETGLAWETLLVSATTHQDFQAAAEHVLLLRTGGDEQREVVWAWFALGQFGALAYAAGLTLAEAQSPEMWTTTDLLALALLRGWRLP